MGQTGVSGQRVTKIRNFIIKPLIWLQGCQNQIENTGGRLVGCLPYGSVNQNRRRRTIGPSRCWTICLLFWRDYFSEKSSLDGAEDNDVPDFKVSNQKDFSAFRVTCTFKNVEEVLNSLNSSKSVHGLFLLSPRDLKECSDVLALPITRLFKKIVKSCNWPSKWKTVFSVSACNTLVTPVTLRCLMGQTGVSGQRVTKIKNFIIKPLIWLQGCQNQIENTGGRLVGCLPYGSVNQSRRRRTIGPSRCWKICLLFYSESLTANWVISSIVSFLKISLGLRNGVALMILRWF